MKPIVRLLAAAALATPLFSACASTHSASGSKRAEAAASTMDDLHATLVGLQESVQASADGLTAVVATRQDTTQDPKQAYAAFSKSVSAVNASASKAQKQLATLRKEAEAHFAKWSEESATITDASLKKSAEQRQQSMAKVVVDVADEMGQVAKKLDPFQKLLADMHTYLGNDLTPDGIKAVAGKAKTISKDASSLIGQIADAIEELEDGGPSFRGGA